MSKESGIGWALAVDDALGSVCTISNDTSSFTLGTPQNLQDVTGLDKSAMERIALLQDATVQITTPAFNDDSGQAFDVMKSRDGLRTVTISGSGNSLGMEMRVSDISFTRNADGSLGGSITLQLADGTVPTWS